MKKQIKIACEGAANLALECLLDFQGDLKDLSTENYKKLKKEILELGFSEPIAVWKQKAGVHITFHTINGHQRLRVLRQLREEGYEIPPLPVVFVDAQDEKEAKRKILALTSQYGEITKQGLYEFMHESDISMAEIEESFQFPEIDFDAFKEEFFTDASSDGSEDEIPPTPVDAKTRPGDLYLLGNHRLLCGDSTKKEDVERLMNGEKADLFLTDPPYGVNYIEKNAAVNGGIVKNAMGKKIAGDTLSLEDCAELWNQAASNAYEASSQTASYYWFACQGGDQMMMMMSISQAKWKVRHELIWVKPSLVFGRCDYHYRHEPILFGWKQDGTHKFFGDRKQTSVLEFDRPHKSDLHPTSKPIELLEYLIANSSRAGELVLDLFLGSGSTLISAEKTARRCFGMEIDPNYCEVIVSRWEKFTGKKAELCPR